MKRKIRKLSTSEHNPPSSCLPCDTKEDAKLSRFINWCSRNGITISEKVILSRNGSCGNIGMVASSAVSVGEQLAYIPRGTLLCAKNSSISQVMVEDEQFMKQLESASSWVPLLTALVYEWSKMNENGKWSPYLQLVPNPESLDPPMMWSKSERERLLSGTSLLSNVDNDLKDIQSDYDTIVKPFMQRHPEIFSKKLISFQLYQELVSFVMSYSFTEATSVMEEEETEERDILEATSMVPVIDLLNHHFRHHAELNARQHYLELIAVRDIAKGEEIMNTYGQHSNTSLLHMYGFALKGNPQDVVSPLLRLHICYE
jgi:SET domain-containing protein 6